MAKSASFMASGQPARDGICGQLGVIGKGPEPQQRPVAATAFGGQRGEPFLQAQPHFIGHVSGQVMAAAAQRLDPGQCRFDFVGAARDHQLYRIAIEPRWAGPSGSGPNWSGIIKQDERRGHAAALLAGHAAKR